MPTILYHCTSNPLKYAEAEHLFRDRQGLLQRLVYEVREVVSSDLREVVLAKASTAYKLYRVPLFVAHGGLYIDYLNGLPGPLVKPVWEALERRLCGLIPEGASRAARCLQMVCYCDGKSRVVFESQVEGTIAIKARGDGIHWHPVFIPDGASRTFGEMSREERQSCGGMAALLQLRAHLGL